MPNSDGSPKVKAAIRLMIWGGDDGMPMKRQDAAKAAGLADVTLRQALSNPMVLKFYNAELEVLRTGERPRSIAKIAGLRDSAASERIQLDAAKYLDGGDGRGGVTVNVGVNANIAPGYMVDVSGYTADLQDVAQMGRQQPRRDPQLAQAEPETLEGVQYQRDRQGGHSLGEGEGEA